VEIYGANAAIISLRNQKSKSKGKHKHFAGSLESQKTWYMGFAAKDVLNGTLGKVDYGYTTGFLVVELPSKSYKREKNWRVNFATLDAPNTSMEMATTSTKMWNFISWKKANGWIQQDRKKQDSFLICKFRTMQSDMVEGGLNKTAGAFTDLYEKIWYANALLVHERWKEI
jgi:hypothetical protein